ncbi:MAG: serine hydrolase [Thermoleophilaceae bacterium]|nr:serine hydrolase [Thermoleophilaceae bacterium]
MIRLSTLAALGLVGLALAGCDGGSGENGEASAGAPPRTAAPMRPALRSVSALATPGESQLDTGAGLYPALVRPGDLRFPTRRAVARANRWLASRRGEAAFAVVSDRGVLAGRNASRKFLSASLTKAMLLVAFLRQLEATGAEPTDGERASLGYMIRLSDNDSADSIYAKVGDKRLRALARRAGMRGFEISGDWANATLTASDQARFFLALDRLAPKRFRDEARDLLETVTGLQSWGIPAGARPRWKVFFKGGWRPETDGELVHQAALLERGSSRVAIAVLTRANPDMVYGERTVQGVTERLLAGDEAPRLILSKK